VEFATISRDHRTAEWDEEERRLLLWFEKNIQGNFRKIESYLRSYRIKVDKQSCEYNKSSSNIYLNSIIDTMKRYRKYIESYIVSSNIGGYKFKELSNRDFTHDIFQFFLDYGSDQLLYEHDLTKLRGFMPVFLYCSKNNFIPAGLILENFSTRLSDLINDASDYTDYEPWEEVFHLDMQICHLFFFVASRLHRPLAMNSQLTMRMGAIAPRLAEAISEATIKAAVKGPHVDRTGATPMPLT